MPGIILPSRVALDRAVADQTPRPIVHLPAGVRREQDRDDGTEDRVGDEDRMCARPCLAEPRPRSGPQGVRAAGLARSLHKVT